MATPRRWLQFSLRGFFALLTLFALWLGLVIVPNREQRRAVNAIQMAGGVVIYDWQGDPSQWKQFGGYHLEPNHGRGGNQLLTYLFGDEAFQDVYAVVLNRTSIGWQQRSPGSPILVNSSTADDSWAEGVRSMIPTMQSLSPIRSNAPKQRPVTFAFAKQTQCIARSLTFSLRTLFVVTTGLAVWLGIVVNRAREQREAVEAIEALGGYVIYDWQAPSGDAKQPAAPAWLRRTVGDDFFQDARKAGFDYSRRPSPPDSDILKAEKQQAMAVACSPRQIGRRSLFPSRDCASDWRPLLARSLNR